MATFADDALVTSCENYWGKPTIREWAKRDITGGRLTMNVTRVINGYVNLIVTANVDGNYNKRAPHLIRWCWSSISPPGSDLIVQLIILRNRYDI
jgi:hypothetical protein